MKRIRAIITIFAPSVLCLPRSTLGLSLTTKDGVSSNKITDDPKLLAIEQAMIEAHASEVAGGLDFFGDTIPSNDDSDSQDVHSWGDDAFIGYNLGEHNAGLDANYLPKNGNMLFESKSPVLSETECSFIIEEARETILQGLIKEREDAESAEGRQQNQQSAITNSQLGEARLSNMPKTRDWLKKTLATRFYPLLKDRFGTDDIVLYDGLVLGNLAPTQSQPIHRDASLLTLNVALSTPSDYEGGGTYIEALDDIMQIEKGHLLCHAGSAMHAGNAITRGERWVFVLFLLGKNQPQVARRCHARAIDHMRNQEFDKAEEYLQTGLQSIAPNRDHLLHSTMGRLHLAKGNHPSKAFESFALADEAYPICQNALVCMAQLLIDRRRPRAALRRLDLVLQDIGDRDLKPEAQLSLKSLAYGARRDAARCALICADHLFSQEKASFSSWASEHLPASISRIKTCLAAAPNEPTLLGMLDRAEFLYSKALGTNVRE